jgi:hypothetical protein
MGKSMATPSSDIRMEIREKDSTEKICWMDRLVLSTLVFLCFCFIVVFRFIHLSHIYVISILPDFRDYHM